MGIDLLMSEISYSFLPGFPCQHPEFIEALCTRCGRHKLNCGDPPTRPFSYIEPGFTLTMPEINCLRDKTLIHHKKLHLVLDLDNTLVHSTLFRNLTLADRDHLMEKYASKGLLSEVELRLESCRVRFVFGLNLNRLKTPEPEPDLFNRLRNPDPNRLRLKRVDLNLTRLHKQVKRGRFGLPIYLPTCLIVALYMEAIELKS